MSEWNEICYCERDTGYVIRHKATCPLANLPAAEPQPPADKDIVLPPVPLNWHAPFTYAQLAEYGRACRAAALEEAAKVCDDLCAPLDPHKWPSALAAADAIRALK